MKPSSLKIGLPTMLMLLLSICLICFSILSFSSAYSDYKISQKYLIRTQAYYEACNEAYETISDLSKSTSLDVRQFYFQISDTESLYVSVNNNNQASILSWNVIPISTDNYDYHLNVIP